MWAIPSYSSGLLVWGHIGGIRLQVKDFGTVNQRKRLTVSGTRTTGARTRLLASSHGNIINLYYPGGDVTTGIN
jgi:hypothetical protein